MKSFNPIVALVLLSVATLSSCFQDDLIPDDPPKPFEPRAELVNLVSEIRQYSRSINPAFLVIVQDGEAIITRSGDSLGALWTDYLDAVDGIATQSLFYGSIDTDVPSPPSVREEKIPMLNLASVAGKRTLATDYCSLPAFVDNAINQNSALGFIPYAGENKALSSIPLYPASPVNSNPSDVNGLPSVRNYLHVGTPDSFSSKQAYLNALAATNYDLLIVDLFWGGLALSGAEVQMLKKKPGGATRLVIATMNITEAQKSRYYWDPEWNISKPSWVVRENHESPGSFFVKYWNSAWKQILFGGQASYTAMALDSGFDGLLLQGADGYKIFEQ